MGKRGTYLGGSTVIKTKPWLHQGPRPTGASVGYLDALAAAAKEKFVGKTYVISAEEAKARKRKEKDKRTEKARFAKSAASGTKKRKGKSSLAGKGKALALAFWNARRKEGERP